ncbi:MAG: Macrolide export ATP-binding/permease protein MacB [Syntrophomonadaceae bacterium]|nr:Macrolide export ATP-binding/permease protein MacB [Bacillota bacterium]
MQLYHIALNNIRRRKARMLFVLLGLLIGIATMVSVYSVVEAMRMEMTRQVVEFGANVIITPDAGELTFSYGGITLPAVLFDVEQLTGEDVAAILNIPSREAIRAVAPKLLGLAAAGGEEPGDAGAQNVVVVGVNLQQEFMVKPWLRLRSDEEMRNDEQNTSESSTVPAENTVPAAEKEMDFAMLDLAREDLTRLVLSDEQILVGSNLAATLGVMEGDLLTLSGREFQVFAVLKDSGSAEDEQILLNLSAAQALLRRPDQVTVIELAVDYSLDSEAVLLAQLREALPSVEVTSLRQEALRRDEMITRLVRFGTSVSVLILFVGMLVVGLTMSGAVRERTREIGVFRAIGFRKSDVAKIILLEGLIVSVLGGMLGYFMGMVVAYYAGPLLANMSIQVPWRLDIFALSVLLAILIGLLAGILPARQAANLNPAEALRFI